MTAPNANGRRWAYLGAALGGTVSIAANIAHSYVPPAGATADWTPRPGAVVGAVFWPVALFVALEILARVAWPTGRTWQLLRWGGLAPVAFVAALVSYRHLSGLLGYYGEETVVQVLGPLAVDGLMVMATGALLATGHRHTPPTTTTETDPAAADTAVRPAPTPTVPADPAPRTTPDPAPTDPTTTTATTDPAPAPTPVPVAAPRRDTVPTPAQVATRITAADTTGPNASAAAPGAAARAPRPRPTSPDPTTATPLAAPAADSVTAPEPAQSPLAAVVAPELLARARETAQAYRTEHDTPITPGQLAVRLKVTSEQASQALAVLGLDPHRPHRTTSTARTANGHRPSKATR